MRHATLEPGDRVLIRKVGLKGRQKPADKWEEHPYVVKSQPLPDIPVYIVQKEHSDSPCKLLHRNMLLLFVGLPCPMVTEVPNHPRKRKMKRKSESETETETDTSDRSNLSTTEKESETELCPQKYIIPARRKLKQYEERRPEINRLEKKQVRRGNRIRLPPRWMQDGEWEVRCNEHVLTAEAPDVVYI